MVTGGRDGLYNCRRCRRQFTVTVGTIFEGSHIPLAKWVQAFHLLCASKKGMSTLQLSRMLGITYKSSWHMAQSVAERHLPRHYRTSSHRYPHNRMANNTSTANAVIQRPRAPNTAIRSIRRLRAPISF